MNELNNNLSLVQRLINAGADVNAKNTYGLTPLHAAVLHQNHNAINALIQAGADINAKSYLKRTALHFAISNHQIKQPKRTLPSYSDCPDMWVVRKLLEQDNIRINVRDIRGDTPLMWAVMEKRIVAVLALLKNGANPNIRNKDSLTPLQVAVAAEAPCLDIVVFLLFHGASLNFEDKEGKCPINYLIQNVRNTQSFELAYAFLETIALRHRVKIYNKHKLEIIPQLWQHLQNCRTEVALMRSDLITNMVTVYKFMLLGINDSDFSEPLLEVYIPVVNRLLSGFYPIYCAPILDYLSKSNLTSILKITIDAKYCNELNAQKHKQLFDTHDCKELLDTQDSVELPNALESEELPNALESEELPNSLESEELPNAQECTMKSPTYFFSKMDIFILSNYLSRLDVFCLTVAFSKGKIHESMEQIRKRYKKY